MIEENNDNVSNESNLLDHNSGNIPAANGSNTFDQQPIGGGSKFNFSQFPSENDPIKSSVKKAPPKRNVKGEKKVQEVSKENVILSSMKSEQAGNKMSTALDEIPVGGNSNGNFDQKPIGKSNFNLSEFPQGEEQPQEIQTQYSMMQKLKSKAIKLRLSGMQDLLKLLSDNPEDPDISQVPMLNLLKQTTPANLQKSLQCFKLWMQKGREWGEDEAKNAIQNGYINGKANTKKLAIEIIDQMYEQKSPMVEMIILAGFKSKTPKILAGYLGILNEILLIYGIKRMKYLKPYYSEVVRILTNEKLPAVKTEGFNLLKQAYKWVGKQVVEPLISGLKEGIKKQLDTFWETYDKNTVMSAPKDIPEEGNSKTKGKKIDAYDLSEAVDIFKKFNEKWSESVLKAQKWNQKTKLMQQFVKGASIPKIATTDYRHVNQVIRRLINDSNFNVVLWDLKMLAVMSKGLRRHFFPVVKSLFSNVIAKFRDKKTQMVDQTFNTLNDLMYSISIEDILDDIKEGLNDKAPNMRVNLLNWIGKCVEQKYEEKNQVPQKTKEAIKSLIPIFQKLIGDGVSDVRDCMAKNIGKMKLCLGEEFFSNIECKMNKNLASKISVESKETPKAKEKQVKKPEKIELQMAKSSVSSKAPPKRQQLKVKTQISQKQKQKKQQVPQIKLECFQQPSYEDSLTALLAQGFPQQQTKNITAPGAKQRTNILTIMKQNPYQNFNCVLRLLRKVFKDWKEVNLLMNKQFILFLEERCQDINKQQAYVILPFIAEKIGDSKFVEPLSSIIGSMCKRIPGKYLIGHIIKYVKSTQGKKPKLNSDNCSLIVKIIENVSINNAPIQQVIQYAQETYAVPFSRKGAAELLSCVYSYVGEQMKVFLDEVTSKSMDGEFKNTKLLSEEQKKPKVGLQGEAALQNKNKKTINLLDSKPKVDITNQVQRLLPKMNDNANWQNRKESAEALINIISQNYGKVTITCMQDLLSTLKIRINDPNKQLIKVFVSLTGHVFGCVSQKDLKFFAKPFIISLTQGLSDKNEITRRQIHSTLTKIGQAIGKEQLLSTIGSYLEGDKQLRLEVLHLILNNQQSLIKADIKDYAKGIVNCLCDKNKDIRAQAEKLFQKVYERLGLEVFRNIAKDQKPAVAKDLNSLFDKFDRIDKNNLSSSSFTSKGVSPAKILQKQKKSSLHQTQQPPVSAKKRSLSKNNTQKSLIQHEDDSHAATISNFGATTKSRTLIQGDQYFAPLKTLGGQRVQRQQNEQLYIWKFDEIKENQQEELRDQIIRLFREDLSKKMLSFDHRKVFQSVIQLIKICKDLNYQAHIKQVYDIIFKWTFLRLWGGNPALLNIVQVLAPIMSILEKKKLTLCDFQVDLIIAIIRQYFISAFMNQNKISQSLYSIIKCLIILSSGEKVLKKILRQFTIELTSIHRHIKREACSFYRDGLSKLVKTQLMEYVGNEDTLEQASKIRELKNDPDFVDMLYRRFHQNVLNCFGFKQVSQPVQPVSPPINFQNSNDRERSSQRLPPKGHQSTNTMGELSRPTNLPSNIPKKMPPSQNIINNPPMRMEPRFSQLKQPQSHRSVTTSNVEFIDAVRERKNYDTSIYPAPHTASPLGKHLGKLLPPNQSTISFFNSLFVESGEKIANQLSTYAKIIFGSILKSVQEMLDQRREYSPEKIINQITLLQNCIKCPYIIKNIGELLYFGTSFALNQLVYEDQNKNMIYEDLKNRNIDFKIQNFIKVINSIMLRLLEFGHPQEIINILLELLVVNSKATIPPAKTISLIIKCIGRVAPNFTKDIKPEPTKQFFVKANEYLVAKNFQTPLEQFQVGDKQRLKPEDNVINSIKTIILQLCKSLNSQVWEYYQKAMQVAKYSDQHIYSYISSLNIRYPEKIRNRSQQKQNEELRKINELLSKNKSFDLGIVSLKKYISQHAEFNAIEYFTSLNYDQKFITMVVNSLEGNQQRRTPIKDERHDRSQNQKNGNEGGQRNSTNGGQYIQNKIKQLKQKFQDLQQPQSNQDSSALMANRGRQEEDNRQPKEERALQIKRRIEDMKNKMNSAVNRPRQ